MSAYVVVEIVLRDEQARARYSAAAGPTVLQFGGEFVARGEWTALAGVSQFRNGAIIRFDSAERAEEWYRSPAYQATIPDRDAGMDSRFRLIG